MRFPTTIVAATAMFAMTLAVQPASADFTNPGLYTAFDNHLFSDPTEMVFANLGMPSAFAGCSATERSLYSGSAATPAGSVSWKNTKAYQLVASMGGCERIPAGVQSSSATLVNGTWIGCHPPQNFTGCKPYHANIASLAGADDNLLWNVGDAQVCFYDASHTVISCDSGFTNDDTHSGKCIAQGQNDVEICADDSITQLAAQYTPTQRCVVVHQYVPNGAAYVDLEAPSGSVNVMSAFWQDPPCLN